MEAAETRQARWEFAARPSTPTHARRVLAEQLRTWGIDQPDCDPILLVANELVANAVDHARTALELVITFDGTHITVDVCDHSELEPRLQPLNPTAARGRGLQMVDALSKSWHWFLHAGGKTVQAVIIPELLSCAPLLLRRPASGGPARPRYA